MGSAIPAERRRLSLRRLTLTADAISQRLLQGDRQAFAITRGNIDFDVLVKDVGRIHWTHDEPRP